MTSELLLAAGAALSGAASWGACHPASQLFGPTLRGTGQPTAVALTFDDGPNPRVTPELLDLLESHQVTASFFLIGQNVLRFPQLAAEVGHRGHAVANHTHSHPNLVWQTPRQVREELKCCQDAIEGAAGVRPRWMRPPYGFRGPHLHGLTKEAGLAGVVMWSVSARDWNPRPAASVMDRLKRVRGGDIVLLHDGDSRTAGADRSHTLESLRHWLPRWKDAGISFITVDTIPAIPGTAIPGTDASVPGDRGVCP